MVIDRDFERAYEPDYDEDFCLDGDLVTGQSCMSCQGEYAQEFYGGIEGCYVVRFEDNGEQVGRCIMYEYNGVRHFIRIYAYKDYARCALRLLRKEMKEGDLFGRSEAIPNLKLPVDWSSDTHTMYLDGRYYYFDLSSMCVVNKIDHHYDLDFDSTGNEEFSEYANDAGYSQCSYCGEWHHNDDGVYMDGEWYCCSDCAEACGYCCCEHCGEWFYGEDNGYESPDGCKYCCESCLESAGYCVCEECSEIIHEDDALDIRGHKFCGEDCARNNGYDKCAECGGWFYEMAQDTTTGEYICPDCAKERGLKIAYVKDETKEVKND